MFFKKRQVHHVVALKCLRNVMNFIKKAFI